MTTHNIVPDSDVGRFIEFIYKRLEKERPLFGNYVTRFLEKNLHLITIGLIYYLVFIIYCQKYLQNLQMIKE